jgi:hypothetical protein
MKICTFVCSPSLNFRFPLRKTRYSYSLPQFEVWTDPYIRFCVWRRVILNVKLLCTLHDDVKKCFLFILLTFVGPDDDDGFLGRKGTPKILHIRVAYRFGRRRDDGFDMIKDAYWHSVDKMRRVTLNGMMMRDSRSFSQSCSLRSLQKFTTYPGGETTTLLYTQRTPFTHTLVTAFAYLRMLLTVVESKFPVTMYASCVSSYTSTHIHKDICSLSSQKSALSAPITVVRVNQKSDPHWNSDFWHLNLLSSTYVCVCVC